MSHSPEYQILQITSISSLILDALLTKREFSLEDLKIIEDVNHPNEWVNKMSPQLRTV